MAGDVGIHEQVVVHPAGVAAASATAETITALNGGVTHEYGPRVVIAAMPASDAPAVRALLHDGEVAADAGAVPDALTDGLDTTGALGLTAFALRQSTEYFEAKAERPLAGAEWDAEDATPPGSHDHDHDHDHARGEAGAGAATSSRLTGKVAVGVIIVEGPTPDLKFSAAERAKVVAEVQNGLTWLGSQSSPAGISWSYDIKVVSLTVKPGPSTADGPTKEALWRDPAMKSLGYSAGMGGVTAYVEHLRTTLKTDWAYCAFFTKYPLGHFAYASIGGPRLVMQYANDGWGPDNIDRVFAHETGHIFGAPDEYSASGCSCSGGWGPWNVPNSNCATCAPGGGVPCLMKSNDWAMCSYTPYHLGFPQGLRYSGVFLPGSGGYALWANADWPSFHAKWQQWSSQGLRLTDLEVVELGGKARYAGVFASGNDGHGLWVNADWPSFQAKWKEWSGQGLRLVDLEITQFGGQTRYSGVFRAGSGAYGLWVNADWASFVSKWQQWSGQGMRLKDLEVTEVGGQPRFSGAFVAGSGAYALWANADWPSFQAKWQELSGQGLRLTDLEISKLGGKPRFSGVWVAGTGGHGLWVDADWPSFQAKWKEWSGQGLRLVDFALTATGIEVAASQVAGLAESAAEGAGTGFASLGGVTLSSGVQVGAASGAGFGIGGPLDTTAGGPAGAGPEGFGEAVLGAPAESGNGSGHGAAVHGAKPDGNGAAPGHGAAFTDVPPTGESAGAEGFGAVVLTPGDAQQADESSPSGFGAMVPG